MMDKPIAWMMFVICSLSTFFGSIAASEEIVFDLTFRGLSGEQGEIRYADFWDFGNSDEWDTPFTRSLNLPSENARFLYYPFIKESEWALVEMKGKEPKALYIDLDADGELDEGEKVFPKPETEMDWVDQLFVTPDFEMTLLSGRKAPYRTILQQRSSGEEGEPDFGWCPACIWEGSAEVSGKILNMIIFDDDHNGVFRDFGSDSFYLGESPDRLKPNWFLPTRTLSRLIRHDGQIYRVHFEGYEGSKSLFRVVLQRDDTPTGTLILRVRGKDSLKTELSRICIKDAENLSIVFEWCETETRFPAGAYRAESWTLDYGKNSTEEWNTCGSGGSAFLLEADSVLEMELGDPGLVLAAVDEGDEYGGEGKPMTAFSKDADIYISTTIKGREGEIYNRFYRRDSGTWKLVEPQIKIIDAAGKEIVSTTLEYG